MKLDGATKGALGFGGSKWARDVGEHNRATGAVWEAKLVDPKKAAMIAAAFNAGNITEEQAAELIGKL